LFDASDRPETRPVVIVSDVLEQRYFPDGGAVGKRVRLGNTEAEIVGVVGSIRRASLTDEARLDMYLPFERQAPGQTMLFVRTSGDPGEAVRSIQSAITGIDQRILTSNAKSMAEITSASLAIPRLLLALLGVFAVVALALAVIGIYGVTSYAVAQQSREIGTRIALGASRRDIYIMVLRRSLSLGAVGAAIGLAAALGASRVLQSVLYATSPSDPIVSIAVPLLLLAVVVLACLVPARRAARVEPVKAIAAS
jgi:ABC-type antimicrobial peptide transport system permease subunit